MRPLFAYAEKFLQKNEVFGRFPWPLFNVRIEVTSPPLATVLRRPVYPEALPLKMVQLLANLEPGLIAQPLNDLFKVHFFGREPFALLGRLPCIPQTHPLEH
jgi:hypothetical protein